MRNLSQLLFAAPLLVLGACQVADSTLAPPSKPRFLDGCEATGPQPADPESSTSADPPPPTGCEVSGTPVETDLTYLGAAHNYSGTFSPDFYGQPFGFDDVANSPGSYSVCPDVLTNVYFAMIIEGSIENFQSVGDSHIIGEVPILSDGFSRATYQLPFQNMYSRSGRHYLPGGGTVKVACINGRFAFIMGGMFNEVDVQSFRVYGYEGEIRISGTSQSGPTSGWSAYNSSSGYSNGSAEGWGAALNTFLSDGSCTPLWDVWIDGKAVCIDGILQS